MWEDKLAAASRDVMQARGLLERLGSEKTAAESQLETCQESLKQVRRRICVEFILFW